MLCVCNDRLMDSIFEPRTSVVVEDENESFPFGSNKTIQIYPRISKKKKEIAPSGIRTHASVDSRS